MNTYEREEMGNIVIIKGITFHNKNTNEREIDHSWSTGRPCLIIYSDDEYDYFLTLTSTKRDERYKKQYFSINEKNILYTYDYKYTYDKKRREKNIKGSINLENIYKTPIYGKDEIKKITFKTYKQIIQALKEYHKTSSLDEIFENATIIRR